MQACITQQARHVTQSIHPPVPQFLCPLFTSWLDRNPCGCGSAEHLSTTVVPYSQPLQPYHRKSSRCHQLRGVKKTSSVVPKRQPQQRDWTGQGGALTHMPFSTARLMLKHMLHVHMVVAQSIDITNALNVNTVLVTCGLAAGSTHQG